LGNRVTSQNNGRSSRAQKSSAHLDDYVCYNARAKDPFSTAHRLQEESSGMPYPIVNYVTCTNFSISHQNVLATITTVTEPRHYHKVVKDPRWREAMTEEIQALEKNETWVLQDLPPEKKPISFKWVYRVKYNPDDTIQRFKARLVICGDHQVEGFGYIKTFAPVAKMTSVCCFLSVAVSQGWELH